MTNTTPDENGWEACPPGTLVDCARRAKSVRSHRALLRLAGVIGAAVVLFLLVVWAAPWIAREPEFHYGGIACREVQSEMQQYMMGGLALEEREKIRLHLAQCPRCQELMKKMQGASAQAEPRRSWTISARVANHAPNGWSDMFGEDLERSPIGGNTQAFATSDFAGTPLGEN